MIILLPACQSTTTDKQQAGTQASPIDSTLSDLEYLTKADTIALAAQKRLIQALSKAIDEGGIPYAIDFCHTNALVIKDSLSGIYGAEVARISAHYRNPVDKPNAAELEILQAWQQLPEGETLEMKIHYATQTVTVYKPILIGMPTCLKCHGGAEDMDVDTRVAIQQKYPEDLATGYRLGELRGAWKISFKR
jgi:hypothetical protein